MYEVEIQGHFDAAHRLLDVSGNCRRLHGHTWVVTARYAGEYLRSNGILADFRDLKRRLEQVLERYDHYTILHETDPLAATLEDAGFKIRTFGGPPTAEILANEIFKRLDRKPRPGDYWLVEVTVQEGVGGKARYGE